VRDLAGADSTAGYNQYGFRQPTRTLAEVQAIYGQLGATVRRLRLAHGWSQDVLSDRSGLHRAHIGEIERGETNVTLQTLKTLADTFHVRITDLLKGL
jgi:ribosome-binding protein aMBF1 (putative translation factor)